MTTRTADNYTYMGLGFPVVITRVEIQDLPGGDHYPVLNTRKLQDAVFDLLLRAPVALTGAQVAFIRKYMDLTQRDLAMSLGLESHGTISQWELSADQQADIRSAYLIALRCRMAEFRAVQTMDTGLLVQTLRSPAKVEDHGLVRLAGDLCA